ncbi:MAG TPA: A24 family peptidase [Castellaniella sp.]|nr:A24 family peptidase [Castellaniella sp.]
MAQGWTIAVWVAIGVLCALAGFCSRRWAEGYAHELAAGARANGRTLWRAAQAATGRPDTRVDILGGALCLGLGIVCLSSGGPDGAGRALACAALFALAWLDSRSGLLPDALTWPLGLSGLLVGPLGVGAAMWAAVLVWSLLAGGARLYRWCCGHEGFGGGDVKLIMALAIWMGLQPLAWVVLLACLSGLGWAVWMQRSWRPRGAYPFGPFLALSAIPVLIGWPAVQSWS